MKDKRLRNYVFTWNNWQKDFKDKDEVIEYFEKVSHLTYLVVGFETGESGTPHLQGLISFSIGKRFTFMRKLLKNNHIEMLKGTKRQARDYCIKDGDYFEIGELVEERSRTDLKEFYEAITNGSDDYDLMIDFPTQFMRYHNMINTIRQTLLAKKYSNENRPNLKVIYIHGIAGSGKTRFLHDLYEHKEIYRVTDYKHPFDAYKGENVLVLDEFNGQFDITQFNNITDIYPYRLPARYNDKVAAYQVVYIISNFDFKDLAMIKFGSRELTKAAIRRIGIFEEFKLNSDNKLAKKRILNYLDDESNDYFDETTLFDESLLPF